jgi:hypothetical protein
MVVPSERVLCSLLSHPRASILYIATLDGIIIIKMVNSHYVPRFVIKGFRNQGSHINVFDLKTKILNEEAGIPHSFSEMGFYSDPLEKELNEKCETEFGNLMADGLGDGAEIRLTRRQLFVIKRYLVISLIRTSTGEKTIAKDRQDLSTFLSFYNDANKADKQFCPFKETQIQGEDDKAYWERTMHCLLNAKTPHPFGMALRPDCTNEAWYWASVILRGYLAFWDAEGTSDEFLLSDIGMTSENEPSWLLCGHNVTKMDYLEKLAHATEKDNPRLSLAARQQMENMVFFHENFMLFPLSKNRIMVSINPFYRLLAATKASEKLGAEDLKPFTRMANGALFEPNETIYANPSLRNGRPVFSQDDFFIYKPVKLSRFETQYCNALVLDRAEQFIAFSAKDKIQGSLDLYDTASKGGTPLNDYSKLK